MHFISSRQNAGASRGRREKEAFSSVPLASALEQKKPAVAGKKARAGVCVRNMSARNRQGVPCQGVKPAGGLLTCVWRWMFVADWHVLSVVRYEHYSASSGFDVHDVENMACGLRGTNGIFASRQGRGGRQPGHFCSQHIFHVKTAGLTRFDRLETPLSASYHQAVAQ